MRTSFIPFLCVCEKERKFFDAYWAKDICLDKEEKAALYLRLSDLDISNFFRRFNNRQDWGEKMWLRETRMQFRETYIFRYENLLVCSSLPQFQFWPNGICLLYFWFLSLHFLPKQSFFSSKYQIDKDQTFFSQRRRSLWSNSND